MTVRWLHPRPPGPPPADAFEFARGLPSKAAALVRAAHAGLPVPVGFAIPLTEPPATWSAAAMELLASGPVIVRSALAIEDDETHSAAGLGLSVPDVGDLAAIEVALAAVAATAPSGGAYTNPAASSRFADDYAIVQRQVDGRFAIVAAIEPEGSYIEVHAAGGDPFARGEEPFYAGDPQRWIDPAASEVVGLLRRTAAEFGTGSHGLDVELVVSAAGAPALVQARPLVAPLHPGWSEFVAELSRRGEELPGGTLILDDEHNPAPLSVAHAWLLELLSARRPGAGGPMALAGWLYVRSLPRAPSGDVENHTAPKPVEVLEQLRDEILPAARERLLAIQRFIARDDPETIAQAFDDAIAAFVAMVDIYLTVLIPARRGHGALVAVPDDPLCLRDRDAFADVLPLAWDVASPSIAIALPSSDRRPTALPRDPAAAATLLREWDDHLFALGLAPLRAVVLRAAAMLGITHDEAFASTAPELAAALRGADLVGPVLAERRAAAARSKALRPPPRIIDGRPAGPPPRPGRGLPIGTDYAGPVTQRRDLEDLCRRPPEPGAIVILPTLTAPAALVLARSSVRAVVTERGGVLGHGALMARELGLSALLGCRGAGQIAEGTRVRIDTRSGRLRPIDELPRATTTTCHQPDSSALGK